MSFGESPTMVGAPKVCTSVSDKSLPSVGIMEVFKNYWGGTSPQAALKNC